MSKNIYMNIKISVKSYNVTMMMIEEEMMYASSVSKKKKQDEMKSDVISRARHYYQYMRSLDMGSGRFCLASDVANLKLMFKRFKPMPMDQMRRLVLSCRTMAID